MKIKKITVGVEFEDFKGSIVMIKKEKIDRLLKEESFIKACCDAIYAERTKDGPAITFKFKNGIE